MKQKQVLCFKGGGCGGRNSNFPYRKLFTPDLNVFSLYKSYYIILHTLHHPSLISTEPKYVQGFSGVTFLGKNQLFLYH